MGQKIAEERYYDLADDVIGEIEKLIAKNVASVVKINYTFQGDRKLKTLFKVSKIADKFAYKLQSNVMVEVNQNIWDEICHDEENVLILFQDAFSGLKIDGNTGKVQYKEDGFKASKAVLDKYEYDKVYNAKELETLTLDQLAERALEAVNEIDISV